MRQRKTKSGRVPYGTERGPGCRCRVRSPLLCGTSPFYGTGARADARIRTSVPDPRLNPQTAYRILSKLNCKKHERIHQREARILFPFKNTTLKFFLKLLGETRTRIRILGSGSIKKTQRNAKCKLFRILTWSGSANHTKTNANAYGSGFLNPDSRIFRRTPDSHRIQLGNKKTLLM
jgi:hypothetical protein